MKQITWPALVILFAVTNCSVEPPAKDDVYYVKRHASGVKMIEVQPGDSVWTQKIGSGKTAVVLLHGGPGATHEYFENFPQYIDTTAYSIIFYDQSGSFFSTTSSYDDLWNRERFVNDVAKVREAYGLTDFYLVGHSWGGILAMLYASEHQDHLKGLILSNTPFTKDGAFNYRNSLMESIEDQLNAELGKEPTEDQVTKRFQQRHRYGMDSVPDAMTRFERHVNPDEDRFDLTDGVFDELGKKASNINVPVLVIGGGNDFIDPEDFKLLAKSIKTSRLVVIPGAPHFPMWSHPESYFAAVNDYLKN